MAWAGGEEVWPCAYEIVRNYQMDNPTISALLVEIDLNGRSSTEVATEWLQNNRETWEPWAACGL